VTSLILQYQATLESALENPPTLPLDVPAGPTPLHPGAPRRVASRPAAPKSPASSPTRTTKNLHTQHTAPHMGRRRALATLAGMAAGGLAVAGWDLGPWRHHATSAHTTGTLSQDPAAKPLIKPGTKPGTQVWRYPVNSAVGALAVANGVVYAGTDENNIVALDGRTGKLLWRRATSTGFNEQLVVAGGFVVAADPDQGGMVAIGATTGTEAWSVPGKNEGILGLAAGAGAAFAGIAVHDNTTGGVTAYDPGTGTLLWTYEFGAVSDTNAGLVVAGRVLYGTTTNGDVFALDAARGTQLWRVTSKNVEYSFGPQSLLIDGGILYAAAKSAIHAVHTRTGKELWQAPGIPGAGLAMAGGTIFAGVTTGPMTASAGSMLAISAANGSRQWTNPVASGAYLVTPGPGDVVYSGSNAGVLDAWRASTGAKVWSFPTTGAPIASNIAVAGGGVFFGSNDHHVYAVAA
jgi:outer membrane protein assembly factor BamB